MNRIKRHFALWRIALYIGAAAIIIPTAVNTLAREKLPANERTEYWSNRVERRVDVRQEVVERRTDNRSEYVDKRVEVRQDVNDRRREHYQDRLERRW